MKKTKISLKIERCGYNSWMVADYVSPLGETYQERHLLGIGIRPYHMTVSKWVSHNSESHEVVMSEMVMKYMASHVVATSYGPDHDEVFACLEAS